MYFPFLDNIRGIAILLVLLVHSVVFSPLAKQGDLGVSLFFSLSGFLLSYISCEQFYSEGDSSFRLFWQKRVKRLLPATLVFLIILLLLSPLYPNNIDELFRVSTLQTNFNNYLNYGLDLAAHTWSLSAEIQYYLLFSFIILIFNKCKSKSFNIKIIFLTYTFLLLFLIFFSLSLFFWNLNPNLNGNYKFCPPTSLFQLSLGSFFGCSFFALYKINLNTFKFEVLKKILLDRTLLYINLIIILGLSMFSTYPIARNPWSTVLFSMLSSALIFQCSIKREIAYFPALILKNKFIASLGKISFSLYLYHYLINQVHRKIFEDFGIQNIIIGLKKEMILTYYAVNLFQYFSEIMISIFLAYLSFNFIERHFSKSRPVNFFPAKINYS